MTNQRRKGARAGQRTAARGVAKTDPAWFELRPGFPPGEEIARIVGGQVSAARRALTQIEAPLSVRVHDARTACKRIRAALALVGEPSSRPLARLKKRFRDLGRSLSDIREATVMTLTYKDVRRDLVGKISRDSAEAVRRLVSSQRRRAVSDQAAIDGTLSDVKNSLLAVGRNLGALKGLALDAAALAEAFGASYKQARRAFLRRGRSPAGRHRWRKLSKGLLHQCTLLAACRPQVFRAWRRELSSLDDLLGQEHDLYVLDAFLKDHCSDANAAQIREFRRWINFRRAELGERANELGLLIYSEKPRGMRDALMAWLELAAGREKPLSPGPSARAPGKGPPLTIPPGAPP
jgi:CHAD domain-containing protein